MFDIAPQVQLRVDHDHAGVSLRVLGRLSQVSNAPGSPCRAVQLNRILINLPGYLSACCALVSDFLSGPVAKRRSTIIRDLEPTPISLMMRCIIHPSASGRVTLVGWTQISVDALCDKRANPRKSRNPLRPLIRCNSLAKLTFAPADLTRLRSPSLPAPERRPAYHVYCLEGDHHPLQPHGTWQFFSAVDEKICSTQAFLP